MHVSLNGLVTETPSISAVSSASLYGKGVFTTLAIRDGEPFLWDKHWKRITDNAAKLSIDISQHSEESALASISELVSASALDRGRARLTFFDGSSGPIWPGVGAEVTHLLVLVAEARPKPNPFRIASSPHFLISTSPLAGVKSCNYLERLMAYEEARGRGFDEAIRLNERGHITSACMANLFWEKNGKLFTPSLSTGCLPGTTREFVLENFECEEVESGIEILESSDRIFLTSAGLGVAPAAEFEGRELDTAPHPLPALLPY